MHCNVQVREVYSERLQQYRHSHNIHVTGTDVPAPVAAWSQLAQLGVTPKLLAAIPHSFPTPIQMQAIPAMLAGRELLACAPTGSGKTAAFLIPVLSALAGPRKGGYRAVVVVPTRELATQIAAEAGQLAGQDGPRCHALGKVKAGQVGSVIDSPLFYSLLYRSWLSDTTS